MEKLGIKQWASEDRPREKLMLKGIDSLSDAELIAILIGSGNRTQSAVELSRKILQEAGNNLNELAKFGIDKLMKNFSGIGEAKAISIVAALELGKRRKFSEIVNRETITSSKDAADLFRPTLIDLPYEEFWVLSLNRANKIIGRYRVSKGGISGTVADIRLIMKYAVEKLASAIILCHNHPSGNCKPSEEDVEVTKKVREACNLFSITLLDHIIIAENNTFSFADEQYF